MLEIAILSIKDDLHSLVLQQKLIDRRDINCVVVETDGLCGNGGFTWRPGRCVLPTREGASVDVRRLHLIWLRRISLVSCSITWD